MRNLAAFAALGDEKIGIGRAVPTADAAAQLVEVGEAEGISCGR